MIYERSYRRCRRIMQHRNASRGPRHNRAIAGYHQRKETDVPRTRATRTTEGATAASRAETKAINEYLQYLETAKPRRGRKRNPTNLKNQIAALDTKLAQAHGVRKLSLLQKRLDLQDELNRLQMSSAADVYEANFIKHGASYSKRKGIKWETWIEAGVPRDVLAKAGIARAADGSDSTD